MQLQSPAFEPGGQLPLTFTRDGESISPPLRWRDAPRQTREFALVFENTTQPFVQWLVYRIPGEFDGLPQGFRYQAEPDSPARIVQGTNSQGNVGYDAPLGSEGRRFHYAFHLLALDASLEAPPKMDKQELMQAVKGHVLDEARLEAVYERPSR